MDQPRLFDSSREGKRRSVLFSVAVLTGFISVVAAASAFAAAGPAVAAALFAVGLAAFAVAVLLFAGRLSGIVRRDQLFWRLVERRD